MTATEPAFCPPIVGVGAVVLNGRKDVLLIRRAKAPLDNEWSIPGGKVEPGEVLHDALRREVREETGLEIEILGLLDVVDTLAHPSAALAHYVLVDYAARVTRGDARAGSDAREVRWVQFAALGEYPTWSETRRVIGLAKRFA